MRDQRFGAGVCCPGLRRIGLRFQARGALGQDQRVGAGEIGGQGAKRGAMAPADSRYKP